MMKRAAPTTSPGDAAIQPAASQPASCCRQAASQPARPPVCGPTASVALERTTATTVRFVTGLVSEAAAAGEVASTGCGAEWPCAIIVGFLAV